MRQNTQDKKIQQKGSIIKWFLIIVGIILLLSYFGFDLEAFMESDQVTENFTYLKEFLINIWNDYIAEYFHIFWNYIQPLLGPVGESLNETDNILDLINGFSIPDPAPIGLPEIIQS